MVGAGRRPVCFPTIFCPRSNTTSELSDFSSLVSIGVVGIHSQPWPEVSRPVWPQRAVSSLNRLRAEALGDLAIGTDASLSGQIDGPVWSVPDRGTAGAGRSLSAVDRAITRKALPKRGQSRRLRRASSEIPIAL